MLYVVTRKQNSSHLQIAHEPKTNVLKSYIFIGY